MDEEFDVLDRIHRRVVAAAGVAVGVGDDAAVLDRAFDLVTTDLAVEDVHFRRDWCAPESIGWRAVVASLSDVAAMGGRAGPYVVGAALADDESNTFVGALVDGMCEAGEAHDSSAPHPVGGDLTSSPDDAFLAVAMLGESPTSGAVLRSGAEPGDRLVLVGHPGRSAAGIAALQRGESAEDWPSLIGAYRRPTAKLEAGRWLAEQGEATAMLDVSDGLLRDLGHLADASEVGARLHADRVPVDDELRRFAETADRDPTAFALTGGEDFCLLAALPESRADRLDFESADWPVAEIGAIVPAERGVTALDAEGTPLELDDPGWQHF